MKQIITILIFTLLGFGAFSQSQNLDNISTSKLKAMGKNSLQMGDTYSAIEYFQAYCNRKNDAAVMFMLAECFRLARDYPQAKIWYEQAYKAKPDKYIVAQYYYATMLKTEQNYAEASKQFKSFKKNYSGNGKIDYKKLAGYQIIACDTAKMIIDSAKMIEIVHLPSTINKASIEFSPQFINDSTILFASLRTDTAVYTIQDDENVKMPIRQFYSAQKTKNTWKFNSEWNDNIFNPDQQNIGNGVFSVDKKRFYFTRCELNAKYQNICKIYVSNRKGNSWSNPVLLPESINAKNVTNTQPAIGTESKKDEEVLYFVSNREGGKGGFDIWYSIYLSKKKEWREPKNCGNKINTPGDELTPFYENKTKTLYFSSTGWPGLGELDIFSSLGELGKWNPAENIGYPINSPFDDLYYIQNKTEKDGLFTSNRTGSISNTHPTCCDDIYSYNKVDFIQVAVQGKVYEIYNKKIQDILESKVESSEKIENDTNTVRYIDGSLVNLYLVDKKNNERTLLQKDTTDKGSYFFDLTIDKDYQLEFESSKVPPTTLDFTTKEITFSDTLILNDVGIEYLSKKPFIIKNIYYDFDKYNLRPEAQQTIDSTLLVILNEAPHIVIELSSHTDSKGEDDYNIELSQKRAESVVAYLIKKGIDKKRLVAKGYGETIPIAPNTNDDGTDNPEGRQKNRRTEFRIIGTLDQYSEIIYEE